MTQERYDEIQAQPHDWIPEAGERVKAKNWGDINTIEGIFQKWHWVDLTISVKLDDGTVERFSMWDAIVDEI